MIMNRIVLSVVGCLIALQSFAIDAKEVLDQTAKKVGSGAASASFTLTGENVKRTVGKILIKGDKFNAVTETATVWFDGTTQWTYMANNDEVNISTPNANQLSQMNPLNFINLYKKGYTLSMTTSNGTHEVHMVAESSSAQIQEVYVSVNAKTYIPTQVRMKKRGSWLTISINNFHSLSIDDGAFRFNKSDYPTAEIIDLR